MTSLIRLYPTSWRDRYGEEFLEVLAERPATTVGDKVDIVRGAIDAWIHPQVRRTIDAADVRPARSFRPGLAALPIVGGVFLLVAGVAMVLSPYGIYGYRESGSAMAVLAVGLVVFGLAALVIARRDGSGRRASAAMLGGGLMLFLGWPILIVGFFLHVGAAIVFGITRLRGGDRLGGAAIVAAVLILTSFNTEDGRALLTIPAGLLWAIAGLSAALRPARTPDRAPVIAPATGG
jgi:hypothetical protein